MKRIATPALVCILALATSACFGATITVPGDHATIGAAVAAASDGDLINVSPGIYTENIVVDKAVVIRGVQGSDVTTLTAASSSDAVVRITSSDVTLSGFTISGSTDRWGAGVWIDGYDYASANEFTAGISDVTVSKCVIESNQTGISVALADGSMLVNNTIRSNQDYHGWGACCYTGGIRICHCRYLPTLGTQVVNNGIYQNDGIGIVFSSNFWSISWDIAGTKIFGNNFYQNGNSDEGPLEYASDVSMCGLMAGKIKISGNKFQERIVDGWPAHGLWVWPGYEPDDAKVVGNPEREELGPNIPMPTP
jgi:parallel beta-helix repeat protein